jgi:hypothetical protein
MYSLRRHDEEFMALEKAWVLKNNDSKNKCCCHIDVEFQESKHLQLVRWLTLLQKHYMGRTTNYNQAS